MLNKDIFLFIYILLFIFWIVKGDIIIKKIDFTNKELTSEYNNDIFLNIIIKDQNNLPNYIEIITQDKDNSFSNNVISYYQENTFTNRKQLSQNSSDITIMWLNKEQIKNGFYLSIECWTKPCNYKFQLFQKII